MSDATPGKKRASKRTSGGVRALIAVAAAAFVVLAVWLANKVPPNITHTEAMTMAATIEHASSRAQLEALLHTDAPRLQQAQGDEAAAAIGTDPAEAIWLQKTAGTYVFIRRREAGEGRTLLLFRCVKDDVLFDYQELRLERQGEQPRIVDVWSMAAGGWLGNLHAERARLENGYPRAAVEAVMDAIRGHEPPDQVAAAFRAVAEPYRSSQRVGVQLLRTLNRRSLAVFQRGIAEYRALHRQEFTADLVVLQAAQFELKQNGKADPELIGEAREALRRIEGHTEDKDFLEPWRGQLH